jgi:hypothetical protein
VVPSALKPPAVAPMPLNVGCGGEAPNALNDVRGGEAVNAVGVVPEIWPP